MSLRTKRNGQGVYLPTPTAQAATVELPSRAVGVTYRRHRLTATQISNIRKWDASVHRTWIGYFK